jgi:hypothetical protein
VYVLQGLGAYGLLGLSRCVCVRSELCASDRPALCWCCRPELYVCVRQGLCVWLPTRAVCAYVVDSCAGCPVLVTASGLSIYVVL